ncbi:MAG: hypothetical protein PHP45_07515 [Elusimicrobiales bacterium]|nr:hypothetical protein [Elusimicrobiales bacterium]
MKKIPRLSAAIGTAALLFLFFAFPAGAVEFWKPEPPKLYPGFENDYVKISLHPWFTSGAGYWRTSQVIAATPLTPSSPNTATVGSTLEFDNEASPMWIFSAEGKIAGGISAEIEYASSYIDSGTGLDHDWVDSSANIYFPSGAQWSSPDHRDFSLSKSDLAGSAKMVSGAVYYRVFNHSIATTGAPAIGGFDILAGYGAYDDRFMMTNGVQLLSEDLGLGLGLPPPGPFAGLNSQYHFHWEGCQVGLRETVTLSKKWALTGRLAWWPGVKYRGEGFWNLRSDLRQGLPSFVHEADGQVLDYSIGLSWLPYKYVTVDAGWRAVDYESRSGLARFFAADGSASVIRLDSASSVRRGFYTGVTMRY